MVCLVDRLEKNTILSITIQWHVFYHSNGVIKCGEIVLGHDYRPKSCLGNILVSVSRTDEAY